MAAAQCGWRVAALCAQSERKAAGYTYTTLLSRSCKVLEVKHSKFIAEATPIDNESAAFFFLEQVSDPRATHNCWAYKLRDKYRFSDDGEPGGTAGRPIFTAIESCGLDGVMVVVTRYFGGTKLGTGGLVRAYGGVATDCLREAPTRLVKSKARLRLRIGFNLLGAVYPLLDQYTVVDKQESFYEDDEGGGMLIELSVDEDRAADLERSLCNACRGSSSIERL